MHVEDFEGENLVSTEEELVNQLRSARRGKYGAFVLWSNDSGPMLWVHINDALAYVHYFENQSMQTPGFQPDGMTPPDCPETVLFLQTDGSEANAIEMPACTICSVELAYRAAAEFFNSEAKPSCINWFEL